MMKRKNLLKVVLIGAGIAFLACIIPTGKTVASVLQDDQTLKEMPNPEKAAKKRTSELKKALGLNEKQSKKIYKLILKEENEKYEMMTNRPQGGMSGGPRGGGGPGGMGGGMMGGGPGGMGGGMMGGGPGGMGGGMGMGPGGGHGGMGGGMGGSSKKDPQAEMEKREKKIKKILTEEQYNMYVEIRAKEMEQQRPPMGPPEGEPGEQGEQGQPVEQEQSTVEQLQTTVVE